MPRLILAHNLHGIDIDLRATQIAALALWLRCQRAYQEMGLKKDRPKITRSNFVCAEPMPGEEHMLKEFVGQLEPKLLGQLVEVVFDKMKLAGKPDRCSRSRKRFGMPWPRRRNNGLSESERHRSQRAHLFCH